jgi:hypothetical protein
MKSYPPNYRTLASMASAVAVLVSAPGGLAQGTSDGPPPSRAQFVNRLVLEYNQGELVLLSQRPLVKVLPPSDELPAVQIRDDREEPNGPTPNDPPAAQLPSGFWFEVLAGDGSVRYRRIMENPILLTFEGIDPEREDGVLERVESVPVKRVFSILVPVDRGELADTSVVFFSSPLEPGAQAKSASEIGRVELRSGDQGSIIAAVLED